MPDLDTLFNSLWQDYVALNPRARQIWDWLTREGAQPRNDHVALRGLAGEALGIDALARPFEALGYRRVAPYRIDSKHLDAWHLERSGWPKVFISELRVHALSDPAQELLARLVAQVPGGPLRWGRPWRVSQADYHRLRQESEYAAWVAAFGLRANHFTVDLDSLPAFPDLQALNAFLVAHGVALNEVGGAIKGDPSLLLEQSSTQAEEVEVSFSDGPLRIPACYVEFARRYRGPDGERFEGFIAESADRIFESTDPTRA